MTLYPCSLQNTSMSRLEPSDATGSDTLAIPYTNFLYPANSPGSSPSRVRAQVVEVIGVLVAAGDGQDARAQDVRQRVDDTGGVAGVSDLGRELLRQAEAAFGQREQHDAAIRGEPAAIKGCGEFLAPDARQEEGQKGRRVF